MKIAPIGLLFVVLALAGCGGGSSSSPPPVTSRSILWATNWGAVPQDPYPSIYDFFYCNLILKGAKTDGTDFVTSYRPPSRLTPVTQILSSSGSVKVGTFQLEMEITTTYGGGGNMFVGIARAVVRIPPTAPVDSQGHQTPDFQIDVDQAAVVESVTVPYGQTIKAGASAPPIFTAHPKGAPSHILALAPYSETVRITSGADHLSYSFDFMTGLTPGKATLTVTVQGVTSAPATVTVVP